MVRDPAFGAVPELNKALEQLSGEKFPKIMAYLNNPVSQRVRTNNHVERNEPDGSVLGEGEVQVASEKDADPLRCVAAGRHLEPLVTPEAREKKISQGSRRRKAQALPGKNLVKSRESVVAFSEKCPFFQSVDRDHRAGRAFFALTPSKTSTAFVNVSGDTTGGTPLQPTGGGGPRVQDRRDPPHAYPVEFDELLAAGMVRMARVPLRFIRPSKEQNVAFPDFEILWGDRVISAEVEGKHEDTQPSANTLRKSLRHGQDQLPAGKPGIIFVRLPQGWPRMPT